MYVFAGMRTLSGEVEMILRRSESKMIRSVVPKVTQRVERGIVGVF